MSCLDRWTLTLSGQTKSDTHTHLHTVHFTAGLVPWHLWLHQQHQSPAQPNTPTTLSAPPRQQMETVWRRGDTLMLFSLDKCLCVCVIPRWHLATEPDSKTIWWEDLNSSFLKPSPPSPASLPFYSHVQLTDISTHCLTIGVDYSSFWNK